MSITWNVHQEHYYSELRGVAYNGSITESDATHVKFASQSAYLEFEGSFTGMPASAGTVTGFRLYSDGKLVLDASGYSMSFKALVDAMKIALDNDGPLFDLLFGGPMVVNGRDELSAGLRRSSSGAAATIAPWLLAPRRRAVRRGLRR